MPNTRDYAESLSGPDMRQPLQAATVRRVRQPSKPVGHMWPTLYRQPGQRMILTGRVSEKQQKHTI